MLTFNNITKKQVTKIIHGALQGRKLKVHIGCRPTTNKVRQAIFSILNSLTSVAPPYENVLDLFAGSGSLGLEALSRGAIHLTAIDMSHIHLKLIREFAQNTGYIERVTALKIDATNLYNAYKQYNLVFIDPPYNKNLIHKTLESLARKNWLCQDAIIVVESAVTEYVSYAAQYNLLSTKKYGDTKILILQYNQ